MAGVSFFPSYSFSLFCACLLCCLCVHSFTGFFFLLCACCFFLLCFFFVFFLFPFFFGLAFLLLVFLGLLASSGERGTGFSPCFHTNPLASALDQNKTPQNNGHLPTRQKHKQRKQRKQRKPNPACFAFVDCTKSVGENCWMLFANAPMHGFDVDRCFANNVLQVVHCGGYHRQRTQTTSTTQLRFVVS